MKILVTGSTGFVGSHFVDYLIEKKIDADIVCTKRWHHSRLENVRGFLGDVEFYDCDLTEYSAVSRMMNYVRPDFIFHFAAESFVSPSWHHPTLYMRQNYDATVNLLEAIRELELKNCRIHIPGSGEEYGEISQDQLPITRNTTLFPVNPYAVSKIAQDLISYTYFKSYGIEVIRTRAFNHEGPRRDRVFGLPSFAYQMALIEKGIRSEKIINTGDIDDKRNFTHVKDMVHAYWLAANKCEAGELYLVGNHDERCIATFRNVLSMVIGKSKFSNEIKINQTSKYTRPTKVPYLIFEDRKFEQRTGWTPEKTLDDIVNDTVEYWLSKPDIQNLDNGTY